ncbi:MAG: PilZ domain-containing protein [Nitrospirae bacterium]|nr:PilZ domain-containing protein [Nitrospirota bacterium]
MPKIISDNSNLRREERFPFAKKIDFSMKYCEAGDCLKGISVNISSSGMCLYVFNPIKEGDIISINSELPAPCKTAMVRWVKSIETDFYMIGVHCSTSCNA